MKRRLTKLVLLFLLGAIVALPLGVALDAMFSVDARSRIHYSGSIRLWLYGNGADLRIWDETGDEPDDAPTGSVYFICRSPLVDMSPIFPTKIQDTRVLHISLLRPNEQELWGQQCDPWRPMLAEYFSANEYDSRYVQGVLLPDMQRERTSWIAVWGNGVIAVVILYGIWPGSHRFVAWRIRLNRERKGCCPMCAYDLRGTSGGDWSAGCPECGWHRDVEA